MSNTDTSVIDITGHTYQTEPITTTTTSSSSTTTTIPKQKKNKKNKENKDGTSGGGGKKKDKIHNDNSLQGQGQQQQQQQQQHVDTFDYTSSHGQQYELLRVQPKGKYDVKMHMTNERTFFKYLFSSFHLGAMGTFLLQYYSQQSLYKPILIGFIWLTAFSFILFGLYTYYQRRQYLLLGRMKQLDGLQKHGPSFILLSFFIIFIAILIYSIDKLPSKTKLTIDGQIPSRNHDNDWKQHQTNVPTPFTTMLPI